MEERYFEQFLDSIQLQDELDSMNIAINEHVTVLLRQAFLNGFRVGIEYFKMNNDTVPKEGNVRNI